MSVDDRASNLLFLLTLPLAIGCATGSDEDTTSSPPMVNPTGDDDAAATDTGTSDGGGTNPSGVDGPGMTTDDPPADATTDEPYVDTTGGYVDTTGGGYSCTKLMPPMVAGPISPACTSYATLSAQCFYGGDPACIPVNEAYCQYAIEYNASMYGPACGAAYEEYFACLSQLTCEQLGGKAEICPTQEMALQTACSMM